LHSCDERITSNLGNSSASFAKRKIAAAGTSMGVSIASPAFHFPFIIVQNPVEIIRQFYVCGKSKKERRFTTRRIANERREAGKSWQAQRKQMDIRRSMSKKNRETRSTRAQ